MAWLCCHMTFMISTTRIPLTWLNADVEDGELEINDMLKTIQVTELHNNVFKQLTHNVTMVMLYTHIHHIEPEAFAGLEGIKHLDLFG